MSEKTLPIETPMRPGRGSHVMDGKQHLSTLKISFPWETQVTSQCLNTLNKWSLPSARAMKGPRILGKAFKRNNLRYGRSWKKGDHRIKALSEKR